MQKERPSMAHRTPGRDYDGKIAGLYDLEETIGRGHFAVVKLARHVFTGEKVAVKVIDKTKLDEVSKAHLFQEVRCMKLVQHPHVVRLYEVIDTQTKLYLVLEWGDGGDMYDYIMKHDGLDENLSRRYFKQIVQAISYCHKLHVVHRDLKPENVVFFEKQGIVKLTDFGFSNKFIPGKKLETSCGSLAYSAPEILLGDSYDAPAVDVWSLGVILFMLVCGTPPFQEANDSETLTMIMDVKYRLPEHISLECKDLVSLCLRREPSQRANLHDILQHPWLNSGEHPTVSSIGLMPLISMESISSEDHKKIIQKMVDGKIAWKDDILKSLETDEYNHITATYYLLAERMLRRQQELANHTQGGYQQLRKQSAPNPKMKLEPLGLSPRVKPRALSAQIVLPKNPLLIVDSPDEEGSDLELKHDERMRMTFGACRNPVIEGIKEEINQAEMYKTGIAVNSLVSPQGIRPGLPDVKVMEELQVPSVVGAADDEYNLRRCSLIKEESEGDDENDDFDSALHVVWSTKSLEKEEVMVQDDDDDLFVAPSGGSPASSSAAMTISRKPHPSNRPLHAVRSSPQLLNQLNQISEECESDDDDPIPPKLGSPCMLSRKTLDSPDMLRKFERRRKARYSPTGVQRGTSCSSSDASDNDEETQKRKEKLKQKFYRRDSSDTSDNDGPGGPGGSNDGGGGKSSRGDSNHDHDRGGRRDDDQGGRGRKGSNGSNSRQGSKKSGGSSRQHSVEQPQGSETVVKGDEACSVFQKEMLRKISNLSISSNVSCNSVSSSTLSRTSSKYVVDSNCSTPRNGSRPEVLTLNELNKVKTRVFHMSAKDFSDISAPVSRENSIKGDNGSLCSFECPNNPEKVRRRSKQRIKTDINSNGLIIESGSPLHSGLEDKTKSKCCSVI